MREMEALILCHSVMVVMRPMAKSMRYILSSAPPKESSAGSTPVPLRMPSTARAMLSKRLIEGHQQVVSGQSTDDTQREVDEDTDGGEDEGGHDGHGHIDAAPIAAGGAAQQAGAIPAKDLQVATRPAQPLAAGLCKIGGLFIVDDGILADGDTVTGKNIVDGKFDILHQQVERPAAAFVQDLLRKEEPGAGNGAAAAKRFPRAIKETAFP